MQKILIKTDVEPTRYKIGNTFQYAPGHANGDIVTATIIGYKLVAYITDDADTVQAIPFTYEYQVRYTHGGSVLNKTLAKSGVDKAITLNEVKRDK